MELFYLALPIAFAVHDIEETAVVHHWMTTNSDQLAAANLLLSHKIGIHTSARLSKRE